MRCRLSSMRSRLSAFATLASVLVLLAGCPVAPAPTPTLTPTPFAYQVRVRSDSTGAALSNAKVTIEVPGRMPLDEFADVNGLAVINIPATHVDQIGRLVVEAAGFETYRQNITLQAGVLPDEIRLSPAAATQTPTPTNTRTPTATPIATNTPTATPARPTILNLRDGDLMPYATSLLGEYPAELKETIRVFVVPPPQPGGGPPKLYPQSYNHCRGNDGAVMQDGRWEQHIQVGVPPPKDVGLRFDVVLTTATEAGNAAVKAEIQRWCDDPSKKLWPGFSVLPEGVSEVDRIAVTRSDEVSRAPSLSGVQLPGAIRITDPRGGQSVTDEEVISGIYSNLPADHMIWVLVYTNWGKWFPQSSAPCVGMHTVARSGQWQVTGRFGGGPKVPYDVVAVEADAAAGAFLDQKQRDFCTQNQWPGLLTIELPPGISEKDRVQVFHQ